MLYSGIQRLNNGIHSIQHWIYSEQHRESRHRILRSCSQIALSWLVQQVAQAVFALPGGVIFMGTGMAICFVGVAICSGRNPVYEKVCRIVSQYGILSLVHRMCLTVFVHETGHAIAGAALYRGGSLPNIQIDFFGGGVTKVAIGKLSGLGKYLGDRVSRTIVSAAGPIASLVFTMGVFAWSRYSANEATAERLSIHGLLQWESEIGYALHSCISKTPLNLGNDYDALHKLGGIHPVAALGVVVLVPTIQLIWLHRTRVSSFLSRLSQLRNRVLQ